jgi:hypothetical protein|tara:strand:+ start:168 stop:626 length:459 start_codon:yes stop_codon:yes gene_type:complete
MSAQGRTYATRRRAVVEALAEKLEQINGQTPFRTAVTEVARRLKFWDQVQDFPTIHIGAGNETREYNSGNFRFRFLQLTIRCYVYSEDDVIYRLEELLEDVETVLEDNDPLEYFDSNNVKQSTAQTTVLSIDTDEGVLEPYGIGEIVIEVQY